MKSKLVELCAEMFDIHPRDLMGPYRFGFLTRARFALYKALRIRGWSYSAIGTFVGGRDHTTIIYGVRRAEYFMERNPAYAAKIKALSESRPASITDWAEEETHEG